MGMVAISYVDYNINIMCRLLAIFYKDGGYERDAMIRSHIKGYRRLNIGRKTYDIFDTLDMIFMLWERYEKYIKAETIH